MVVQRYPYVAATSSARRTSTSPNILLTLVLCAVSFFAGSLWGMQASMSRFEEQCDKRHLVVSPLSAQQPFPEQVQQQVHDTQSATSNVSSVQFPEQMHAYASAMARVSRTDFTAFLDLGVPIDPQARQGGREVLVLYSTEASQPNFAQDNVILAERALQNCDYLNVMLVDASGSRNQCVAMVPQYESFHVQKYMRADVKHDGPLDSKLPLQLVPRTYQAKGRQNFIPPTLKDTRQLWSMLSVYIDNVDKVLEELKPLAAKAAGGTNTVVVMVCNFGQSELLVNFCCSARARNLNLDHVLVFVTDLKTKQLAEGMGLTAFYDEVNFGAMPAKAAHHYGDRQFTAMMMAKVFCVQLTSMLGYDILFQDVDLVWFRNPLEYFASLDDDFDLYFQDDGGHSMRYAPYSANSGFYFVRHNAKTQYLWTALLHAGDVILKTDSHQQALIALLDEHSSLFGLRVKILNRDLPDFPGGYHFHQATGKYMRAFYKGEVQPYIFHMSWTFNKDNKLLFLRQMGEWYVKDQCIAQTATTILAANKGSTLSEACCSAEPLISCHYRDKPSKIPCKDSPPIDKGKKSFW